MADSSSISRVKDYGRISLSEDAAANGSTIDRNKVHDQYWGDNGDLEIVDVDGFDDIVRIDEVVYDDNGNEVSRVGMGFTTKNNVELADKEPLRKGSKVSTSGGYEFCIYDDSLVITDYSGQSVVFYKDGSSNKKPGEFSPDGYGYGDFVSIYKEITSTYGWDGKMKDSSEQATQEDSEALETIGEQDDYVEANKIPASSVSVPSHVDDSIDDNSSKNNAIEYEDGFYSYVKENGCLTITYNNTDHPNVDVVEGKIYDDGRREYYNKSTGERATYDSNDIHFYDSNGRNTDGNVKYDIKKARFDALFSMLSTGNDIFNNRNS